MGGSYEHGDKFSGLIKAGNNLKKHITTKFSRKILDRADIQSLRSFSLITIHNAFLSLSNDVFF
jgi:hypothetical protein